MAEGGGGWIGPLPTITPETEHTWDLPWSSGAKTEDPWDSPRAIASLLGIPVDAYRAMTGAEKKAVRHQAKLAYFQSRAAALAESRPRAAEKLQAKIARMLADPVAALARSAEFWQSPKSERRARLLAGRGRRAIATSTPSAPVGIFATRSTTGRTPTVLGGTATDRLLEILEILRAWYQAREQAKANERAARAERDRREAEMAGFGDVLGGVLGGLTDLATAATPIVSGIYAERAAREMRRAGATGASGVPVSSALVPGALAGMGTSAALSLLIGQPGAMEEGDILERMESDIEREVSLWRRSQGGTVHPVRNILARHPQTGAIRAWEYRGQPILYSGDLAVCKRVNKIARRSASRMGLRFRSRRRR